MSKDIWHFPRTNLAEQVIGMIDVGLANALIFFAPRRKGKTEFLLKDIQPFAVKKNIVPFYFSFLDAKKNIQDEFLLELSKFESTLSIKSQPLNFLKKIKAVTGEAGGIKAGLEFRDSEKSHTKMKQIFKKLSKRKKVLLLLDEIQALTKDANNESFIAGMRTALDMYKDSIKVIFTGSSRDGLRRMFSQANAPFFHFGQNLPFPDLDKEFTDHLAELFYKVTRRKIDKNQLWEIFQEFEKVPQLIRSLVERLALYPNISIQEAKNQLLEDIHSDRAFVEQWDKCSSLERLLLLHIGSGGTGIFSGEVQGIFAEKLGISRVTISSIQSAIRMLQNKMLIGRDSERGIYFVEDPNFKSWLVEEKN